MFSLKENETTLTSNGRFCFSAELALTVTAGQDEANLKLSWRLFFLLDFHLHVPSFAAGVGEFEFA